MAFVFSSVFETPLQKFVFGKDSVVFFGANDYSFGVNIVFTKTSSFFVWILLPFVIFLQSDRRTADIIKVFRKITTTTPLSHFQQNETESYMKNNDRLCVKIKRWRMAVTALFLVCLLLFGISFCCFAKFTEDGFVISPPESMRQTEYSFENVEYVKVDVVEEKSIFECTLRYTIYFSDGKNFQIDEDDYKKLNNAHKLLKEKDINFLYGDYTVEELNNYMRTLSDEKRETLYPIWTKNI